MKDETTTRLTAAKNALGFGNGASKHYPTIDARSEPRRSWVPYAVGTAVVAFLVLPKAVRKPMIAAALPVAVPWLRRFLR